MVDLWKDFTSVDCGRYSISRNTLTLCNNQMDN